ncbi:hypothetical protein ACFL1B_05210 [Nanoarchaeota archaeon]
MVLIEPKTVQTQEVQVQQEPKKSQFIEKNKEFFRTMMKGTRSTTKSFVANLKVQTKKINTSMTTPPNKKADQYVQRCWNHMSRNEVEQARSSYDKLVNVYECLDEGPVKTNLYQEVLDIYSRLSEVKA